MLIKAVNTREELAKSAGVSEGTMAKEFQRIELVRKCEDAVKAQAEQRRLSTLKQNQDTDKEKIPERENTDVEKLPPRLKSRDELGAMAGVSGFDNIVKGSNRNKMLFSWPDLSR